MWPSYEGTDVPDDYTCRCGFHGGKLWRSYSSLGGELLCSSCVAAATEKPLTGRNMTQIGWWVAAVPDLEGVGYWGYTSVPPEGCAWWARLPLHGQDEAVLMHGEVAALVRELQAIPMGWLVVAQYRRIDQLLSLPIPTWTVGHMQEAADLLKRTKPQRPALRPGEQH